MSAIYAKDFASNLHDERYGTTKHSWNAGGLRHVVNVLQERPVAIELDTTTGYTQAGVKLIDVRNRYGGGDGVAVADPQCATEQNPHGITVFGVRKVGVIIPLESGFGSDKYAAIDSERRELNIAYGLFRAETGKLPAGKYDKRSGMYSVTVSHRPDSYRDGGLYQYREYTLTQIQAASLCGTCLLEREGQQHQHHCPEFAAWLESQRA